MVEAWTDMRRQIEVLEHREAAVEGGGLRNVSKAVECASTISPWVDAVDANLTRGRALEADEGLHQRGLAGGVRADEAGDRASRDRQVDLLEGECAAAVSLRQAACFQRRDRRRAITHR